MKKILESNVVYVFKNKLKIRYKIGKKFSDIILVIVGIC